MILAADLEAQQFEAAGSTRLDQEIIETQAIESTALASVKSKIAQISSVVDTVILNASEEDSVDINQIPEQSRKHEQDLAKLTKDNPSLFSGLPIFE